VSKIFIRGEGAVSPAGWGVAALREALERGEPLPMKELSRPGRSEPYQIRGVPAPPQRPGFLAHARLRRTSPIAQYAVAAALEALGAEVERLQNESLNLGIVVCAMSGCVNYSRRFYNETLMNPATASPVVFPETVFNAPASHLGALLGSRGMNYTLVGDPGTFLQGIALAAQWLMEEQVDGCLVIGAEEMDWLTAETIEIFASGARVSEGAGALFLGREPRDTAAIELTAVTSPHLFLKDQSRVEAARKARAELSFNGRAELLCDGLQGIQRLDRDEASAWADWPYGRLSVKTLLGEGLMASAGWQCVAAVDALRRGQYRGATVSVVGCNEQAIAARFSRLS
jgi:hypothetical protein